MTTKSLTLTQDRLKTLLHYNPYSGNFTVLKTSNNSKNIGSIAGRLNRSGYTIIYVDGKRYLAHRLAWLYVTGDFPESMLDHVNCIKNDNRFINIREANHRLNAYNRTADKNSISKYKGVTWCKRDKRWVAQININGINKWLGRFDSEIKAFKKYCDVAKKQHGEFLNLESRCKKVKK